MLVEEQQRPFSRVYALCYAGNFYRLRREILKVQQCAEEAIPLAQAHGFNQWLAHASFTRGWVVAMQGQHAQGKTIIEQGLAAHVAARLSSARRPALVVLAQVCSVAGLPDEGLRALDEAQTIAGVDPLTANSTAYEENFCSSSLLNACENGGDLSFFKVLIQ